MYTRIKAVEESDLQMLGASAHTIQRVLPVTQAEIDAAASLGKIWLVWKGVEVSDPLNNLRGGTKLVIKENSITPDENIRRYMIVPNPNWQIVVVGPDYSPLSLPDAVEDSLQYVKAYGLTEQPITPSPDVPTGIMCNNGGIGIDSNGNIKITGNTETIKDSQNHTVTCEYLLGMASYHDEQEIISGNIIRRCGIKVLDGTEDWQINNIWFEADVLTNGDSEYTGLFCTHFPFGTPTVANTVHKMYGETKLQINYPAASTVEELKTWLAGQYANGTPVIVTYVLKNPTVESVAAQTLQVSTGNNSLTITDGSLSDLKLSACYTKTI